MTTTTNHDWLADLRAEGEAAESQEGLRMYPDPDGDCVEFFVSDESYYAERIDGLLTIYRGQQSKEVVGSLIKNVSRVLERLSERTPNFRVEIESGRVRLTHVVSARLWSDPEDLSESLVVRYRELRDVAAKHDVSIAVPASFTGGPSVTQQLA